MREGWFVKEVNRRHFRVRVSARTVRLHGNDVPVTTTGEHLSLVAKQSGPRRKGPLRDGAGLIAAQPIEPCSDFRIFVPPSKTNMTRCPVCPRAVSSTMLC